jgi:hypothetical protein
MPACGGRPHAYKLNRTNNQKKRRALLESESAPFLYAAEARSRLARALMRRRLSSASATICRI